MSDRTGAPADPGVTSRHRWTAVVAAVALLAALVVLSRDFGATWDERALQKYGEQIWDFYTGKIPRSAIDVGFGYTRIYGGLAEFLSVAAQHAIDADPYVVRHAVNAVFGWVGIVFAGLLAFRLFGIRAGWLAALLVAAMPRYVGESMNNSKDLPFAVLMLAGVYYIATLRPHYPYLTWTHALKLAAAVALALNVRSMGLALLGYTGIGLGIAVVASGESSPRRLAATAGRFAVVVLIALLGASAFWPWAQEQPLVRPIQAFVMASGFSWGNPSLFAGRDIAAADLPWYYLPTWLAITIPAVVIAGALLSIARFTRSGSRARVQLAAMWAVILLPVTMAIVGRLTLYDGIRHMLFVVPPIAVIAAAGWDHALRGARPTWPRALVAVLLALGVAEPLVFQVRNHPNQNVYFTPAIGGPRGAFGRFEMDYWGNCVLQAMKWSAGQARQAQMPVVVTANAWEVGVMDTMRYPALWFRRREGGRFHLDVRLLKGSRQGVLETAARPDILHRVTTADGAPLCVVVPGPEYPQLELRLARETERPQVGP
jgi:hypothetical protein